MDEQKRLTVEAIELDNYRRKLAKELIQEFLEENDEDAPVIWTIDTRKQQES